MAHEQLKLDGQTAKEWTEQLFEFEYCSECGGDAEDHDILQFMGHWFARCKRKNWKLKSPFHYINQHNKDELFITEEYDAETEEYSGKFEVVIYFGRGGYYETLEAPFETHEDAAKFLEDYVRGENYVSNKTS